MTFESEGLYIVAILHMVAAGELCCLFWQLWLDFVAAGDIMFLQQILISKYVCQCFVTQKGPEIIETNDKGRLVRRATKRSIDYSLMFGKEEEEEPKKRRNIAKEEAELDSWLQAMIDNQEQMYLNLH